MPLLSQCVHQARSCCIGIRGGQRAFTTTLTRSQEKVQRTPLRSYFYHVDVHGQLFLTETEPKNITSCFKSIPFLDFFFQRLGSNPALQRLDAENSFSAAGRKPSQKARAELEDSALEHGYDWLSPCGPEMNFVKTEATPVVFRELDGEGRLHWAGSFTMDFDPTSLVVDSESGYLYHPSPRPDSAASNPTAQPSPYGTHSLLSSALVQEHFASSLEYGTPHEGGQEPSALRPPSSSGQSQDGDVAGSVEWRGRRWDLGYRT